MSIARPSVHRREIGVTRIVVAFPAAAALISLACAFVVGVDAWRRPKADKIAWGVAFALFALAAGAEVVGSVAGWTPLLVRVYYLAGAVLVVGFLALGQLYLLAPRRLATIGPGAALLVTAVAATVVLNAPIDQARLASDGWDAIEREPALTALAIGLNAGGTVVLVGGALSSAWRFWRRRTHRSRMIGCVLIASGTLLVAMGGTLTRFGQKAYLYIGMATGVAVIFAGYLAARRPEPVRSAATDPSQVTGTPDPALAATPDVDERLTPIPLPTARDRRHRDGGAIDPAIAFLETRFLPLDDAELAETARGWSVERLPAEHLDRDEARRAWALRLRLSAAGQAAFDAHTFPAKRQLAELYDEVLAPGVAAYDGVRRPEADVRRRGSGN